MPTLTALTIYPVKSCGGIGVSEAVVTYAGLMSGQVRDREWMVVDTDGNGLTQREHPKMALIVPSIKATMLELHAPGMPCLETPLVLPDPDMAPAVEVRVWDDNEPISAYDCGDATAAWFSAALGVTCRLMRFHPQAKRSINNRWTAGIETPALFSDGYPMLVISEASLLDLNEKLQTQGHTALPMNRFRPNLVIDGVQAFEENYAALIKIGGVTLRPVKPCARCVIPSVDQATGIIGPDPLTTLQRYRANPKLDGGITFGMNVILLEGDQQTVRIGDAAEIDFAF